jgi:hypothetical protein
MELHEETTHQLQFLVLAGNRNQLYGVLTS